MLYVQPSDFPEIMAFVSISPSIKLSSMIRNAVLNVFPDAMNDLFGLKFDVYLFEIRCPSRVVTFTSLLSPNSTKNDAIRKSRFSFPTECSHALT